MGSIISPFNFEGYKVDEVNFSMQKSVALLLFKGILTPDDWKLNVSIRQPFYIKSDKKYIGGIKTLYYFDPPQVENQESKSREAEVEGENPDNDQQIEPLIKCDVSISGVFSVEEGKLKKETENTLIKLQIPTILFPYVRATISTLLANAGFGSTIFPLVNMHEVAKQSEDREVKTL